MPDLPKILCVGESPADGDLLLSALSQAFNVVRIGDLAEARRRMETESFHGLVILGDIVHRPEKFWQPLQQGDVMQQMPDGVALVDAENQILWANKRLTKWFKRESLVGLNFYDALNEPTVLGPNYSPLSTALKTGKLCKATLRTDDVHFYQLRAAPVLERDKRPTSVVVTLRDVSSEMLHLQKLEAIHRAGAELADLTPEEVFQMDVGERIELLKANILHYTQDLLKFDVVEIRLLDNKTGRLEPLISVGIDAEESKRPLFARAEGNGVTGFVCATGKSYLCEDTTDDPLYLDGLIGAKSSLTVPLIYHEEVIGTFNVESPKVNGFTESDLQLLEIFARDIAMALNALELLVAQRTNTAQESIEAIHSAVALPIDEILNDTVHVIENFIGHNPDVAKRLRSVLKHARNIKQVIHRVGEQMAPPRSGPDTMNLAKPHALRGQRILVIDADEEVRNSAHTLLERYGCIVETAHEGREAILMIRNCDPDHAYGAIIADIRLPDMNGYELLMELKDILREPPLVLMTGFGYDPGHSIVKARKAGLRPNAVLYKPFRLDQLLEVVESMLSPVSTPAG